MSRFTRFLLSTTIAAGAAAVVPAAAQVQSRTTLAPDIAPAQSNSMRTMPGSIILRGEPYSSLMQRLPAIRQFTLNEVRANPRAVIGGKRINFSPILQNPKALANIAARLSAVPDHVRLIAAATQIAEVGPGLIVRDYLSYQVLPGKCKDTSIRRQITAAGASCFVKGSRESRLAAFANPSDPRFISDPQRRATAVAEFRRRLDQQSAQIAGHIARLRKALSDTKERNALAARFGAAELARIETLNDDQLKEELINSAQHKIERVYFIPKAESTPTGTAFGRMRIAHAPPPNLNGMRRLDPPHVPPPRFERRADQKTDRKSHGPYIFLTGFTYGKSYEWRERVEMTIDFWLVSETYYAEAYANFTYDFGLRFPIQATMTSNYVRHGNDTSEANVQVEFAPINGSVKQFSDTGLPNDQIYDARELVADFTVKAGVNLRLPIVGTLTPSVTLPVDLTAWLSPPYTGGHFSAPAPGQNLDLTSTIPVDLLGGSANFGVIGAKIMPAMKVNLRSDTLRFTLIDKVPKQNTYTQVASGQVVPIAVGGILNEKYSEFALGYPVYGLSFNFTPGLDAQLFIDIDVWSDNWDWFVWFPELSVQFPSGGEDFTCHAKTNCTTDNLRIVWESPQRSQVAHLPPLAPTSVIASVRASNKVEVSWKSGDTRADWFEVERTDIRNAAPALHLPRSPVWKTLQPRQKPTGGLMSFADGLVTDANHTISQPYTYRVCAGNSAGRTCSEPVQAKGTQIAPGARLPITPGSPR